VIAKQTELPSSKHIREVTKIKAHGETTILATTPTGTR
jgi:hypothetical protein